MTNDAHIIAWVRECMADRGMSLYLWSDAEVRNFRDSNPIWGR